LSLLSIWAISSLQSKGCLRDSFCFKELYESGVDGKLALQKISRRKRIFKNRVEEHIEKAVVVMALDQPAFGKFRVSNEPKR